MDEPSAAASGRGKNGSLGWIIAVVFVLFVLWAIYTSTQTLVVESGSDAMEMSATQMPDNMPGMDH